MIPRQARGRVRSLTRARETHIACRTCGNRDEGDNDNHQESVIGGETNAPRGNVGVEGGIPSAVVGGAEFMQVVFTTIEQVVRNVVQTIQVPVRTAKSRATTAMKAFLQLRPLTFKG